jgi:hypothetical protein
VVSDFESDAGGFAAENSKQSEKPTDPERREALLRLAKYTAPAVLAVLASTEDAGAAPCVSPCV